MKRLLSLMLIGILLLSGCEGAAGNLAGLDQDAIAGLLGTAQAGAGSAGEELLKDATQTMTPYLPETGSGYKTPTPIDSTGNGEETITATKFEALSDGKALIYWDAEGEFPEGFKVVWSQESSSPVFPDDIWDYISDGDARSAEVFGSPGESYYFRVCKYSNGVCAFYSPVVKYTFEAAAEKTATTANTGEYIKITSIQSGGTGKANVYWEANGSFPKGFKVVWSSSTSEPVYPGNEYQYLSSEAVRSTTISGTPGKKVYFRVCRYDGSKCNLYSNSYAFTYAGAEATESANKSITINNISNVGSGKALVEWSASGSFPKGFKVVWSSSTTTPVYPGNDYVYKSDPSTRSAYVTATAGKKYYFRVCEYLGSGCGVYSNTYTFTFSGTAATATPDTSTITLNSVTAAGDGKATVSWSASGSFPSGFKVVWSDSNTAPVYPGNDYVYLSNSGARSATITGTPGQTVYVRVGKYVGGSCSIYSNMITFTFPGGAEPTPKPTEVTPTEVTPTEVTPTEVTPTEVTPTEVTPTEVTPTEVTPEVTEEVTEEPTEESGG
jgi:hypothetical protein